MCCFYMGIAQIALDPRPSVKQANVEKKCPKPSWQAYTPPPPFRAMPIWKQLISKRGFPNLELGIPQADVHHLNLKCHLL